MSALFLVLAAVGIVILLAWPLLSRRRARSPKRLRQPTIDRDPIPPADPSGPPRPGSAPHRHRQGKP